MAEREIGDGTKAARGKRGIVFDQVVGRRHVSAVRDQGTLGVAGGAGGIDHECRRGRVDGARQRFESSGSRAVRGADKAVEGCEFLRRVSEHRRVVDHDDTAQRGELLGDRKNLVDVLLAFSDEDRRTTVAHLVLHLRGGGGGVNAVGDRACRLCAEIGDHPFLAGVRHDGDALAGAKAERLEPQGTAPDERRVFGPCPFAVEPQMLGAIRDT